MSEMTFHTTAYGEVNKLVYNLAHAFAFADGTGGIVLCTEDALSTLEGSMTIPYTASELKLRNLLKEAVDGGAGDMVIYPEDK